ncbi:hypothetical protein BB559_001215 [Furculomyces boomerangus]|uniref:Choline/carnitine acyltransferase domain-containing protein n=2 Tax=Harpellales TaxID=61421 RepID=A0A2T9Z2P0_9FUNG|nr:hypothetical protein BB559_001215 [Furculomyces boomerangus]PVZ97968.1 hypothetical protein BB558_006036 [Smittium angustum]PVZ99896.1 hypothetical protein BB558_004073 [Smittium angustum]
MTVDLSYLDNSKDLPKLPVPSMEQSVEKLIKTVKPLFNGPEFDVFMKKVDDFMDPERSIGRILHKRLEDRANDPNIVSWVEEWWNEAAYFTNRQSICFHVNYYFGFRRIQTPDNSIPKQAKLAAAIISSITNYRNEIITGVFKEDTVRGTKLCMHQFRYQFGTSRQPGESADETVSFPFEESKHIAIAHKGLFYSFNPYNEDGSIKSIESIEGSLAGLINNNKNVKAERTKSISVLTTLERDDWHYARESLLNVSDKNKESLHMIESSAFLLSLDDNSPKTYSELSKACYTSDGLNRFYDKCFQVLVFANGRYGFNGEHSLTDGTTDVRLSRYFVSEVEKYFSSQENINAPPGESDLPTSLEFDYNITLKHFIRRAWSYFDHYTFRQEVSATRYTRFGKNTIKKFKVSPDSFAQMAVQLAYYRLYDHFVATYESASTRAFAKGRTETSRSISEASMAWCRAMMDEDPRQMAGEEISDAEKAGMLRQAIKAQSEYTAAAARAMGIDRYFMGLRRCILPGEEWPELFHDNAFKKSSYWQLSTSQISEEFMDAYGWGQVVYDGFGIAYMVLNDCYHFNVCSTHLGSQRLCDAVCESMDDMFAILLHESGIEEEKAKSIETPHTTASIISQSVGSVLKSVSSGLRLLSLSSGEVAITEKS